MWAEVQKTFLTESPTSVPVRAKYSSVYSIVRFFLFFFPSKSAVLCAIGLNFSKNLKL